MKLFRIVITLSILHILVSCAGPRGGLRPQDAERVVTHKVEPGETWDAIAEEFYGDRGRAGELAVYNGQDTQGTPEAGSGVRIPLSKNDLRSLRRKLDAASEYNAGLDLAAKGNYAEAIERFKHVLEIDPIFSDASFNLAVTYQKLGLHRNAAAVLEDLMSRFPDNPGYLFALGHSLYHIGDLGGARETFSDVLSIDPGHLKALFSLAVVCEKMGREDEARRMWVEYLELDPKGEWAVEARSHLESLLRSDRR